MSMFAIVGVVIGAFAGVLILVGGCLFAYWRKYVLSSTNYSVCTNRNVQQAELSTKNGSWSSPLTVSSQKQQTPFPLNIPMTDCVAYGNLATVSRERQGFSALTTENADKVHQSAMLKNHQGINITMTDNAVYATWSGVAG